MAKVNVWVLFINSAAYISQTRYLKSALQYPQWQLIGMNQFITQRSYASGGYRGLQGAAQNTQSPTNKSIYLLTC